MPLVIVWPVLALLVTAGRAALKGFDKKLSSVPVRFRGGLSFRSAEHEASADSMGLPC